MMPLMSLYDELTGADDAAGRPAINGQVRSPDLRAEFGSVTSNS
jgi:hypothetical protein